MVDLFYVNVFVEFLLGVDIEKMNCIVVDLEMKIIMVVELYGDVVELILI